MSVCGSPSVQGSILAVPDFLKGAEATKEPKTGRVAYLDYILSLRLSRFCDKLEGTFGIVF